MAHDIAQELNANTLHRSREPRQEYRVQSIGDQIDSVPCVCVRTLLTNKHIRDGIKETARAYIDALIQTDNDDDDSVLECPQQCDNVMRAIRQQSYDIPTPLMMVSG